MKELLPLGSVVHLVGGTKKIMIIGRIQESVENHKVYDYCACYYPEGILDPHELFLFMQKDIEHIYFIGMQDEEELNYRTFIQEQVERLGL